MSSITIPEVIQELRNRGFEGFDAGDLTRYIDWGFRKIVRMANWDWEQAIATVQLEAGVYKITVGGPDDPLLAWTDVPLLRDLMRIIDTTSGQSLALKPISDEEWTDQWLTSNLDDAGSRGNPDRYYFEWANAIYILPPPQTQKIYKLYMWQYIGDADSGLAYLPPDWEEAVLLSAECICHYRARQPEFAQECEMRLGVMVADMLIEQNMKDPAFQERVDGPWSRVR